MCVQKISTSHSSSIHPWEMETRFSYKILYTALENNVAKI